MTTMMHLVDYLTNLTTILQIAVIAGIFTLLWLLIGIIYTFVHMRSYPHCCRYNPEMLDYVDKKGLNDTILSHRKKHHMLNAFTRYVFTSLILIIFIPFGILVFILWIIGFILELIKSGIYQISCCRNDNGEVTSSVILGAKNQGNGNPKKIAVIGCGPSGLVTAKYMLDEGFDVTVYEKSSKIGGSFAHSYDGYLTSSNYLTQFSDLSMNECDLVDAKGNESKSQRIDNGTYLSFKEYCNYLTRYSKTFNIYDKIKFNSTICNISDNSNIGNYGNSGDDQSHGRLRWTVKFADTTNLENEENNIEVTYNNESFDHICICTGIAGTPKIPKWVGNVSSRVPVYHSSELIGDIGDDKRILDKNILIVGCGESGSDLSYKISQMCNKCNKSSYMITRRNESYGYIIPKFTGGIPADMDTSRMYHTTRDWGKSWIINFKRWLEGLWFTPFDDISAIEKASSNQFNKDKSPFEHFGTKNYGIIKAVLYQNLHIIDTKQFEGDEITVTVKEATDNGDTKTEDTNSIRTQDMAGLAVCEKNADASYANIDESLLLKIIEMHKIEAVLLCTGFRVKLSFLDELESNFYSHDKESQNSINVTKLYENVFDINYREGIMFIGFRRPMIGSLITLSELSARYAAMVIDDKCKLKLPTKNAMLKSIDFHIKQRAEQFPCHVRNNELLVDFLTKYNATAKLIGCDINLWILFIKHPLLMYHVLTKPLQAIHYKIFKDNKFDLSSKKKFEQTYQEIRKPPAIPWAPLVCELFAFMFFQVKQSCHWTCGSKSI